MVCGFASAVVGGAGSVLVASSPAGQARICSVVAVVWARSVVNGRRASASVTAMSPASSVVGPRWCSAAISTTNPTPPRPRSSKAPRVLRSTRDPDRRSSDPTAATATACGTSRRCCASTGRHTTVHAKVQRPRRADRPHLRQPPSGQPAARPDRPHRTDGRRVAVGRRHLDRAAQRTGSSHHARQPPSLLWDGVMPTTPELVFDLSQLGPHPLRDRDPPHPERPGPRPHTDVREAEKVERLCLPKAPCPSSFGGVPGRTR